MNFTKEYLIQLCQDAVVPCNKWNDRDSYSAQVNIQSIYEGLTGGVPYNYTIENKETIWIYFQKPTKEQKQKFKYLEIDSREDYFEWYKKEHGDNYDPEMFYGHGINWEEDYLGGYIPTRKRLDEANGDDWY